MSIESVCEQIRLAREERATDLELGLDPEGVDDHHLRQLRNVRQLERLYLIGSAVTDNGVKHLSHLTRIRALALYGTST